MKLLLANTNGQVKINNLIYYVVFLIGLSELGFYYSEIRYLKYLILPLALFVIITYEEWKSNFNDKNVNAYFTLVLWSIVTLIINNSFGQFGLKDVFFISVYVFSILAFFNNSFSIKILFYIYSIMVIVSFPSSDVLDFSLVESTAPFESTACFALSAFCIYFMQTRDKIHIFLSLILVVLTLKRIVIPPLIIAFLCIYCNRFFTTLFLGKIQLYVFVFAVPIALMLLTLGFFDYIIEITTGRNANWITLGRTSHYQGVIDEILENPLSIIFGNGIGSSYAPSVVFYKPDELHVGNLHSDFLKIIFELGVVFYIYFFHALISNSNSSSRLYLYLIFFLYLSDNSLIYSGISFVIMAILIRSHRLNLPINKN